MVWAEAFNAFPFTVDNLSVTEKLHRLALNDLSSLAVHAFLMPIKKRRRERP